MGEKAVDFVIDRVLNSSVNRVGTPARLGALWRAAKFARLDQE